MMEAAENGLADDARPLVAARSITVGGACARAATRSDGRLVRGKGAAPGVRRSRVADAARGSPERDLDDPAAATARPRGTDGNRATGPISSARQAPLNLVFRQRTGFWAGTTATSGTATTLARLRALDASSRRPRRARRSRDRRAHDGRREVVCLLRPLPIAGRLAAGQQAASPVSTVVAVTRTQSEIPG